MEATLPFHPSIPRENIFSGKDLKLAERVTTLLENHLITNLRAAQTFAPVPGDIILVSGPCSGEDIAGKVLAALISKNAASLALSDDAWTLPWIESSHAERKPDDLRIHFFSEDRGVFRTQMAMSMLNPRQRKGPKYVVLLRHPLDMRACFYKYVRACVKLPSETPPGFDFDEVFSSADSFVNVPVTLCQVGSSDSSSYEQFISDWYRESRTNSDVLLMFYEALIHDPGREVRRLAAFLAGSATVTPAWKKKATDPAFVPAPLSLGDETISNILSVARFIDKGNEKSTGKRDRKRSTAFRRISMAVSRKARSLSRRSGSSLSRGSFHHDGDGEEGMGGAAYEDPVSIRTVQRFWESRVGPQISSYEKLYEMDMAESYPFPQLSLPKARPEPIQTPIKDSLTKAVNVAKNRLTNVLSKTDSFNGRLMRPLSILKSSRTLAVNFPAADESPPARGHADSMLPAQAFAGNEWTSASAMNHAFAPDFRELDEPGELDRTDHDALEEAESARPKKSQLSTADSSQSAQTVVSKFVSQEVMEANMLRTSMRLAGVDKAIVDVVAVRSENLSEML